MDPPALSYDLRAVKRIAVLDSANLFARSDTVCIVGIGITVKRRKLSALLI